MKNKGEVALFFRVLEPRLVCGGNEICRATYEDWLNEKNTSTHGEVPPDWVKMWQDTRSTDPKDYLLPYKNGACWGEYTEAARDHFITLLKSHGDIINFKPIDLLKCGEYKGVSAYDNLRDALNYAHGIRLASIAVFCGQVSGVLPDLDNPTKPTAYAAEVITRIDLVSLPYDNQGKTITAICALPEELRRYIEQ